MAFTICARREFANGIVYALETEDGYPIETTDTFLPHYTKFAIQRHTNAMKEQVPEWARNPVPMDLSPDELDALNKIAFPSGTFGTREERWMIGVSTMSGCPVRCKFCATAKLKKFRNLTADEIAEQVEFVLSTNPVYKFQEAKEHKINYTRMGEPFLNIENVKAAIEKIEDKYPNTHHYISTIGLEGSDFSWIKDNITLQISLHSLDEKRRDALIPIRKKMSIEQLGQIRTKSKLKTTVNLTMVDAKDWDIKKLRECFDPEYFFIKVSPINPNEVSKANNLGDGIIKVGKNGNRNNFE